MFKAGARTRFGSHPKFAGPSKRHPRVIAAVTEALEQRRLLTTYTVTTTADAGAGSLREAITSANGGAGDDTIAFNIPGSGVHTISPATPLPEMTGPTQIDGYSQPGASANTQAVGDDAVILIEINGANVPAGEIGIHLAASDSSVRGLSIVGYASVPNETDPGIAGGNAIVVDPELGPVTNVTIAGNFLGLDPSGVAGIENANGIYNVGTSVTIGGLLPADRNVISNNANNGIFSAAPGAVIQGNYIGTDRSGIVKLFNGASGVILSGVNASGSLIGGNTVAARNVVQGNNADVALFDGAHDNTVQGNYIGVNATGTATFGALQGLVVQQSANNTIGGSGAGEGNVIGGGAQSGVLVGQNINNVIGPDSSGTIIRGNFIGVSPGGQPLPNLIGVLVAGSSHNTLGGTGAGEGNTIQFNRNQGVVISTTSLSDGTQTTFATSNTIIGNSIYKNGALGIDLADGPNGLITGVTADDAGDVDAGNNDLQNKPNIASAAIVGGQLQINGSFLGGGAGAGDLTLHVYISDDFDPSGFGEGQTYVGSATLSNGGGTVNFGPLNFAGGAIGQYVTATLTDSAGNTSEFSNAASVGDPFLVTNTNDDGPGSLRRAIQNVNGLIYTGVPTVHFAIPGAGVHTITPASPLPFLTKTLVIDGYTQSGSSANTLLSGDNAVLTVQVDGTNAGETSGFELIGAGASGSTIKGLSIVNFKQYGILLQANSNGNTIAGNFIGTTVADGSISKGNGAAGISISSQNNTIGGTNPADMNVVARNALVGVGVINAAGFGDATGNRIVGNSIHDNGGIGIDLKGGAENPSSITQDDSGDSDTGPNNLQNKPNLTSAVELNGQTIVSGTFLGSGSGTYRLDVYASDVASASGFGDGAVFLGEATINNGNGTVTIPETFFNAATIGQFITATLTDANGNTSEFSNAVVLAAGSNDPLVVTNTNDSGNGSLRVVMTYANGHANGATPDRIRFAIPGGGVQTIAPPTALPTITDPVIIDGYTQTGASANTAGMDAADNAKLLILVSGAGLPEGVDIFKIDANNSQVRGLVINGAISDGVDGGDGIHVLPGRTGNVIAGNFIGTNADATDIVLSQNYGVFLDGAPGNTVGGTAAADRNVISGNFVGVEIKNAGATGNTIEGNFIGSDATGTKIIGPFQFELGVEIQAPGNTVGGTSVAARNLISGNQNGIRVIGAAATGNTIEGNYIGTDVTGNGALGGGTFGNSGTGILDYAGGTTIGGTTAGAGNLISGSFTAILLQSTAGGDTVQGNTIGLDVTGTHEVRVGIGIDVESSPNHLIGGTTAAARNYIVVGGSGVNVIGAQSIGTLIQGNYIGTNKAGTADGNNVTGTGVSINSAGHTVVGGTTPGAGNLISGNLNANVSISGSGGHVVQGNLIGTNAAGTAGIGGSIGVFINFSPDNTIGGTSAAARNVISGNDVVGVDFFQAASSGNVVQGNYIGTDITGTSAVPNGLGFNPNDPIHAGVVMEDAPSNTIGGTAAGAANIIAFNAGNGVTVTGIPNAGTTTATANIISRNSIFSNTGIGIDLNDDGVTSTRDALDADGGANGLQNIPIVVSAIANGAQTKIHVQLANAANKTYTVEFFSSPAADPTGFGEGQTYIGSASVSTNSAGAADTTITLPISVANGAFITATVTNATDGTSEFAKSVAATAPAALPTLSINNVTLDEGDSGTKDFTFTITRSGDLGGASSVKYATADGTAAAPDDYTAVAATTVNFASNEASKTVTVKVKGDTTNELTEAFNVVLSNPAGATIASGTGVGTITNDDQPAPAPTFSINSVSHNEGNTGTTDYVFTITRSGDLTGTSKVDYATADNTAAAPEDYTAVGATTLTFTAGQVSKTVTVKVRGDAAFEPEETFAVLLSNPVNAGISGGGAGVGTIQNDDAAPIAPTVAISDVSKVEGNSGMTAFIFNVTRSGSTDVPFTVDYATADGSASSPADYTAASGTLTFNIGDVTQTITVFVNGDTDIESAETFTVTLSNFVQGTSSTVPASTNPITRAVATGTIQNDDSATPPPTSVSVGVGEVSKSEGNSGKTAFKFNVTRTGKTTGVTTVQWNTQDATATVADNDYVAASGTVTFAKGEKCKTITVYVVGDKKVEADETFRVFLHDASAGTAIVDPHGTGTIKNDDKPVVLPIASINDVSGKEPGDGRKAFTFTISLDRSSSDTVTVSYKTLDGSARAGTDYTASSGTVTFKPGEKKKTITVYVLSDNNHNDHEGTETFHVTLLSASNAQVSRDHTTGDGTITDPK